MKEQTAAKHNKETKKQNKQRNIIQYMGYMHFRKYIHCMQSILTLLRIIDEMWGALHSSKRHEEHLDHVISSFFDPL